MSSDHIKKTDTSTVYHYVLVTHLSFSKETMYSCKKYTTQSLTYQVKQDSDHCLKYVHLLYQKYDLMILEYK